MSQRKGFAGAPVRISADKGSSSWGEDSQGVGALHNSFQAAEPFDPSARPARKRVVVVGCGFAGLQAAIEFGRRYLTRWADVVVVDSRDYHLFTPLLYEAATGAIHTRHLQYPVMAPLRKYGIRFEQASVQGVLPAARRLQLSSGELSYDYLVVAGGSQTNFFGRASFAARTHSLKTAEDADRLHSHIVECIQQASRTPDDRQRQQLLTFAIVGAGATGVELAASLQQALQTRLLPSPWRDASFSKVVVVEACATILGGMPESLGRAAAAELSRLGIYVMTGCPVEMVTSEGLTLKDHAPLPAATVVWTAGVRGSSLPGLSTANVTAAGRLVVDPFLRLPEHPEIFVIGDMAAAAWSGKFAPANAPAAIQMGRAAARNVTRGLLGLPPIPFRYQHEGDLLSLGRQNAAAHIGGRTFTGLHASLLRRAVYLANLMGMKNRVGLAADWWKSRH